MGRKRIRDIRNEELIEATISAVYERGYAAITVSQIAQAAGASTGSVHYYFSSKEGLFAATMRHIIQKLHRATLVRLATATTPRERLMALVAANFDDTLYTSEQCNVWMQFWANAPYQPSLARLQIINRARVRSNFSHELRSLVAADDLETVRLAIQAYMDGDWLHVAQTNRCVNAKAARRQACDVVTMLLAR